MMAPVGTTEVGKLGEHKIMDLVGAWVDFKEAYITLARCAGHHAHFMSKRDRPIQMWACV